VLTAHQLTLWRGSTCLFDELSLEVPKSTCLLVKGANGSGKTTLLRVLSGLTRPESGTVKWGGAALEHQRAEFGAALAYFGHATGLKADLTARQNLAFAAKIRGQRDNPWQAYVDPLELSLCLDLEVRYLSAGQKRRVALARVLMSAAVLWILDEPFANLDDAGRDYLQQRLQQHLEGGGSAVIAAHHDLSLASPVTLLRMEDAR
jgi:heme exporter protein A